MAISSAKAYEEYTRMRDIAGRWTPSRSRKVPVFLNVEQDIEVFVSFVYTSEPVYTTITSIEQCHGIMSFRKVGDAWCQPTTVRTSHRTSCVIQPSDNRGKIQRIAYQLDESSRSRPSNLGDEARMTHTQSYLQSQLSRGLFSYSVSGIPPGDVRYLVGAMISRGEDIPAKHAMRLSTLVHGRQSLACLQLLQAEEEDVLF